MRAEFRTQYLIAALNAMQEQRIKVDMNLGYLCKDLEIIFNPYNVASLILDICKSNSFTFSVIPYTPNDECATIRLWDSDLILDYKTNDRGTFILKGCVLPQGKYEVEILMSYVNMEEFEILCHRICIT